MTFSGNFAEEYGPEIAGVAQELIMLESESEYLRYMDRTSSERYKPARQREFFQSYSFTEVQSGGNVPTVYFGLVDKYN